MEEAREGKHVCSEGGVEEWALSTSVGPVEELCPGPCLWACFIRGKSQNPTEKGPLVDFSLGTGLHTDHREVLEMQVLKSSSGCAE